MEDFSIFQLSDTIWAPARPHLCIGKRVKADKESHDIDGDDIASVHLRAWHLAWSFWVHSLQSTWKTSSQHSSNHWQTFTPHSKIEDDDRWLNSQSGMLLPSYIWSYKRETYVVCLCLPAHPAQHVRDCWPLNPPTQIHLRKKSLCPSPSQGVQLIWGMFLAVFLGHWSWDFPLLMINKYK